MENTETAWHLDKKVPLTIITMFFIQTVTLVYVGAAWKADTDQRLAQLERSNDERKSQESRIIVLEQGLAYIRNDLTEIKALLKSKVDRP